MNFIRSMKSHWIKTKRTPFRNIVTLVPILFPLLILLYISTYTKDYTFQIKVYQLYFGIVGISLSGIVSILTALNIMEEESAGDFRALMNNPMPRKIIFLSKFFMLVLVVVIDMFISTSILLLGMKFIYNITNIQYGIFLEGTLFAIIGSLFLHGVYFIIAIAFGSGPVFSIGLSGIILGGLLETGLGDRIWQFVPWAWSPRFPEVPIYSLSGYTKFAKLDNIQGIDNAIKDLYNLYIFRGISIALIAFIVIVLVGLVWFEKWEGRKN